MAYQIQLRRDTTSNWATIDPILAQGEPGYEIDTGKIKYGDGVTPWSALPYFSSGGSGGNTTPGGPINSVQFNANGSFSGSTLLTLDVSNANVISTGTIVSQYFVGDGSQLSNIPTPNLISITSNIVPSANVTYSLGNATNQWKELWISGNTIYLGGLPLSKNANGNITYDDQELIAQSNTGQTSITNLTSEDANITNIVSNNISSQNIIAAFIAGDGSNITNISYNNIIDAYSNANVASYLPNNSSNVAAAYFIGDGSQLTNLPVLDNYSNANVASYLPNNTSNVAAAYFIGDGSQLTNLPVLDNYSNANVASYLPTYSGNLIGLTGEVVTTANVDCNYILGNGAFLTGIEMAIGSYSNANVNSYLPIYNGNISADIITTTSINPGNIQFGTPNVNISTQSWVTAQSNSLSNVIIYQIPADDIASVDFNIVATSNNNRQVCKLVAVVINTLFEYSEYGSLNIGPLLGNFTIDLVGGNLLLNVEPFTSNTIDYSVVFTTYGLPGD